MGLIVEIWKHTPQERIDLLNLHAKEVNKEGEIFFEDHEHLIGTPQEWSIDANLQINEGVSRELLDSFSRLPLEGVLVSFGGLELIWGVGRLKYGPDFAKEKRPLKQTVVLTARRLVVASSCFTL